MRSGFWAAAVLILTAPVAYGQCGAGLAGNLASASGVGNKASVKSADSICTFVAHQQVRTVAYTGDVAVGQPLPESMPVYPIPGYPLVFANVNGRMVLANSTTLAVIEIVGN
jgi:hypothetical protein